MGLFNFDTYRPARAETDIRSHPAVFEATSPKENERPPFIIERRACLERHAANAAQPPALRLNRFLKPPPLADRRMKHVRAGVSGAEMLLWTVSFAAFFFGTLVAIVALPPFLLNNLILPLTALGVLLAVWGLRIAFRL